MSDVMTDMTRASEQLDEVIELLADMVAQHCGGLYGRPARDLDSMALGVNADAMRYLAKLGRIEIESEYGRRVIGHLVEGK